MKMPLEGHRVLELSMWLAGPLAGSILGDMGADVIKIEHNKAGDPIRGMVQSFAKGWGDGKSMLQRNTYFEHCNRNKKSITVDLSKPEGKQIIYELVKKSDVFLQNTRKGVTEKLKLDYATLSKINPKLIYATLSGWGPKGPDIARPSFDFTGVARSGLMTSGGQEGDLPYHTQTSIADQLCGMQGVSMVITGLLMREKWGIGQEMETSMLGNAVTLQGLAIDFLLMSGKAPDKWSRTRPGNPLWNIYKCKDDKWLCLGLLQSDRYWPDLCRALGLQDLINDPRFNNMGTRIANNIKLVDILDKTFASKNRSEWMDILEKHGDLLFEPVNTLDDVVKDPQVIVNNYVTEYENPTFGKTKTVGFPMTFGQAEQKIRMPAPEFGQHTEEILHEILGYSWEKIEELKGKEII